MGSEFICEGNTDSPSGTLLSDWILSQCIWINMIHTNLSFFITGFEFIRHVLYIMNRNWVPLRVSLARNLRLAVQGKMDDNEGVMMIAVAAGCDVCPEPEKVRWWRLEHRQNLRSTFHQATKTTYWISNNESEWKWTTLTDQNYQTTTEKSNTRPNHEQKNTHLVRF